MSLSGLPASLSSLLARLPPPPTLRQWGYIALLGAGACQASWLLLKLRTGLRGPVLRPFGGLLTLLKMVIDPVGFWDSMARRAQGKGMSLETLFGTPVVFVTDNALSKEVRLKRGRAWVRVRVWVWVWVGGGRMGPRGREGEGYRKRSYAFFFLALSLFSYSRGQDVQSCATRAPLLHP